ncbi:aquaporin-like [Ptychodera flava]|uniref:aquaporin-like n=1 Tax=Ptychodera flava TaxID=63121 RepID=UPI00396A165B
MVVFYKTRRYTCTVAFIEANSMSKSERQIFELEHDETQRSETSTAFDVMQNWIRPIFAEFVGTMIFVFVGSLSSVVGFLDGKIDPALRLSVSALTQGFIVVSVIAGLGQPSGGHINPAITLGVLCSGGMAVSTAIFYVIFQLVGALCGAILIWVLLTSGQYEYINGGVLTPGVDVGLESTVVCEWILTTVLVSTALQVSMERGPSTLAPLVIGLTVVACILAGGAVSGACMNPARIFGPAVVSGKWTYHWTYWLGPVAGAVTSALIYRLVLASPDKRLILKSSPNKLNDN